MDRLIRWALENRITVLLAAGLLLAWGMWTTLRMPVDVFPDLTAPTVTVITEAHGLPAQEVEVLVTFPIEAALNGASGVRRVRSVSAAGISIVWAEFDWDSDKYLARQIVNEKLQLVRGSMPEGVDEPVLAPISSIMGEIMFVALEGKGVDLQAVRAEAEWNVRKRLLAVPGVAQVVPMGGDVKVVKVEVGPEKLKVAGISVDTALSAVQNANRNVGAGVAVTDTQEFLVRGIGRAFSAAELGEAVVTVRDGSPILLRHIAEIREGPAFKRGVASLNGKPAVIIAILKQPGANTLTLSKEIDRVLDEVEKTLPAGISLNRSSFRQADFIQKAISNVSKALRDGGLLVILVLFLFLANFRASIISLSALPLSLLAAVITLHLMGSTFNTMTLGGFTIAIGALVDDAIIGVENAFRRLRENSGKPPEDRRDPLIVVFEATKEIRGAIVYATVIIILVFLPLFFLSGIEGRLLKPLGTAYAVSLMVSLVVALVVTPVLCYLFLGKSSRQGESRELKEGKLAQILTRRYRKDLDWALGHPMTILVTSGLCVLAVLACIPFLGRSFLPKFKEGALTVAAVTLPGTSLEKSDEIGRRIEGVLLSFPEVVSTSRRTGRADLDEHAQGPNASEIEVVLKETGRGQEAFVTELRRALSQIPGVVYNVGQPISHRIDHMLSGTKAAIAVKFFGEDLDRLREVADSANAALTKVPGIVDVAATSLVQTPQISVTYIPTAMARHGVSAESLSESLEIALQGVTANRLLQGTRGVDVILSYPENYRRDVDRLGSIPIQTASGAFVPLGDLAEIRYDMGPVSIEHENVRRKAVLSCNVEGVDLRTAVNRIRVEMDKVVGETPGVYYELGGQFESETEASRIILWLSLLVLVIIFFLLYLAFDSFKASAIVLLNLPLALVGGIGGILMMGGNLDVASMVGLIALFGIAVRNGVLLVFRYQQLQAAGHSRLEAIRAGSVERLTPVLMTAITAALALIPLIIAMGKPGNEIQSPMAVVIFCGLATSTALNMLVLPVMSVKYGIERRSHLLKAE